MLKYKNILVLIDSDKQEQPALERSILLAQKNESTKITLLVCCYDMSFEMTSVNTSNERELIQELVVKDKTKIIKDLVKKYETDDLKLEYKVLWHHRPFVGVIEEILKNNYDLVIKSTYPHPKLLSILLTPTDWNLLRKCPVPVLLVKNHHWPENGNILCAIDCKSIQDEEHDLLNKQILEEAHDLASMLEANVHIVSAYPVTPMNIMIELPEFNHTNYEKDILHFHQETLNNYLDEFNKTHDLTHFKKNHLKQGTPEDVISDTAKLVDAELLILGTVNRSKLSSILLGNTAEQIIDEVDCDILALKPDGFVSPIKLEEEE